ncbi:hypothetical protein [Flavobacterium sp. XGLA_31]|uniref:hypothetical protein n=1 Tax=Flavobacterium sp. XGLA_31 TaxID=3447666 RepID=UPI003F398EDB
MFTTKFWLKFSLINLCIVASLGLLMRYKIGFEFPYFNQKSLQHSHSHFAFGGWISHTLMVLLIHFLQKRLKEFNSTKYNKIIIANLVCSYGMLISFILQGYGLYSIFFSTASILVAYVFGYSFFKDVKPLNQKLLAVNWFKSAVGFNILSSAGTFYLAYMMATKNVYQDEYLASIYYYLHFQYNGWFFFGCMGLLFDFFNLKKEESSFYQTSFKLFFASCIPAYFLSTLWLNLPLWLYIITVIAAFTQVYSWFRLLYILSKRKLEMLENYPFFLRYILLFVAFALSVKLLLQLGSTIPSVSQLAFGFRPIVIAYLHLVLLAIISLFLLFYIYANSLFHSNQKIKYGIILFSVGVLLNEIVLAIQGIASFSYTVIPFVNQMLFGIAILLVLGILITTFYSIKKVKFQPLL